MTARKEPGRKGGVQKEKEGGGGEGKRREVATRRERMERAGRKKLNVKKVNRRRNIWFISIGHLVCRNETARESNRKTNTTYYEHL